MVEEVKVEEEEQKEYYSTVRRFYKRHGWMLIIIGIINILLVIYSIHNNTVNSLSYMNLFFALVCAYWAGGAFERLDTVNREEDLYNQFITLKDTLIKLEEGRDWLKAYLKKLQEEEAEFNKNK